MVPGIGSRFVFATGAILIVPGGWPAAGHHRNARNAGHPSAGFDAADEHERVFAAGTATAGACNSEGFRVSSGIITSFLVAAFLHRFNLILNTGKEIENANIEG
jgi:hypothetical protein